MQHIKMINTERETSKMVSNEFVQNLYTYTL